MSRAHPAPCSQTRLALHLLQEWLCQPWLPGASSGTGAAAIPLLCCHLVAAVCVPGCPPADGSAPCSPSAAQPCRSLPAQLPPLSLLCPRPPEQWENIQPLLSKPGMPLYTPTPMDCLGFRWWLMGQVSKSLSKGGLCHRHREQKDRAAQTLTVRVFLAGIWVIGGIWTPLIRRDHWSLQDAPSSL